MASSPISTRSFIKGLSDGIGAKLSPPRWCPHAPTARQAEFLATDSLEALFGGQAGGGKSDALLMGALEHADVPGYEALILRKTFRDLNQPGAIMSRAKAWLSGTAARWNDNEKRFTFPSGATLTFGYLDSDADVYQYQGAEFQFVGFDELTQFKEFQYRYLISRVRRLKGASVPLRLRSATNPGGIGHDWVKERFISPGDPSRPFVPSALSDNPHLDADEYRRGLSELDPVTRAQLMSGDWDVRPEGMLFKREWLDGPFWQAEPDEPMASLCAFIDLAATAPRPGRDPDYTAMSLLGRGAQSGRVWILDFAFLRAAPADVETALAATAARWKSRWGFFPIVMEEEGGASGVSTVHHYATRVFLGYVFRGLRKTAGMGKMEMARPLATQMQFGNVRAVRSPEWNLMWTNQLLGFPGADPHDDLVDATTGALSQLSATASVAPVSAPVPTATGFGYRPL